MNEKRLGGVWVGFICSPLQSAELRIVLILVILSLKNLPKELAKVVLSEQSGNGLDCDLCRMRLILLHNFLGLFLFSARWFLCTNHF